MATPLSADALVNALKTEGVTLVEHPGWAHPQPHPQPRLARGWPAKSVIAHKEWTNTKIDPRGYSLPDMRARISKRLLPASRAAAPPAAARSPP